MKRCSYRRITSRIIILLAMGLCLASPVMAAVLPFTEVPAITDSLTGVAYSSAAWGDYDNDGDLDILLTGYNVARHAIIYRNDEGTFVDIEAGLTGVSGGSVAWGDYDNDGDLDILLTGYDGSAYTSKVYRNDGDDSFTDIDAGLLGVDKGVVAWGDYDNDGDLDILLLGSGYGRVYRNDGGIFTNTDAWLYTYDKSAAAWGDYDNDGDLDILVTNYSSGGGSKIYENDGGSFTALPATLTGVWDGSVAWGDYDNDGDLDILLTGYASSSSRYSLVYKNTDGSFASINAGLEAVYNSSVAWGDYDNDGDLDILLTGYTGSSYGTKVYRNDGSDTFVDIEAVLTNVSNSSVAWGDYDNDGDLDILLTGFNGSTYIAKVYENNSGTPNVAPFVVTGLESNVNVNSDSVALSWYIGTDTEPDAGGLSYNLRVGTTSGGEDLMSAQANLLTGYRRIPALGNAQENLYGWNLYNLPDGTIYWSVQSIDHAFTGSAFATEQTFEIAVPPATPQNLAVGNYYDIGAANLTWDQNTEADILRYRIYMNTETVPTTLVDSTDTIGDTTISITGLIVGTQYFFRIKAVDTGMRESLDFSNEVTMTPALYSLKTDSLALVDLSVSTNWASLDLTTPVSSWPGVTVTDGQVAKVILSGYFISGTIPSSIGNLISLTDLRLDNNGLTSIPAEINNLTQLTTLYLNNNQLVDLPDLTALTAWPLRVQNNKLTFEDLVPNIPPVSSFRPQDSVGTAKDTTVEAGTSLSFSISVGGAGNQYSWKRDGYTVSGAYDDTLTIDPVSEADSGSYICITTNTGAYLLRIYSRPIHVVVTPSTAPQNLVALAGNGQVTLNWNQTTATDFLRYRVYSGPAVNPSTLVDSTSSITDTTTTLTDLTNDATYYFRVTTVDVDLNESGYSNEVNATPTLLSVSDQDALPTVFALHPAYPNPFNPTTTLRFDLPEAGDVSILVYDLMGREVVRLVDSYMEPGYQQVVWYGLDEAGRQVPTGVYIVRMVSARYTKTIKMVLLK